MISRGLHICDFRFLVASCWYLYTSLMATSSPILNVQLIVDSYFDCIVFDFCLFQKIDQRIRIRFLGWIIIFNMEHYLQVMRNLREAIRQKRPDLWMNKNWLLHFDKAAVLTSLLVREFLAKNNTIMLPQPP